MRDRERESKEKKRMWTEEGSCIHEKKLVVRVEKMMKRHERKEKQWIGNT